MPPLGLLASVAAFPVGLAPPRVWLDRLAFLVPGATATRWLLMADLVCLVALGTTARWPRVGIPAALGVGFLALNLVSMGVADFYLGLTLFHLGVGVTAVFLRQTRWVGLAVIVLTLLLGVVT